MAETYLLVRASGTRLLFPARQVRATLDTAPVGARDLADGAASAWVACDDGACFGVNQVIGLVDLDATDFAPLPKDIAAAIVDAVTIAPIRGGFAFRVR